VNRAQIFDEARGLAVCARIAHDPRFLDDRRSSRSGQEVAPKFHVLEARRDPVQEDLHARRSSG
jgi:hypothetical protein